MSSANLETPYWSQDARELAATLGSGPGGLPSDRAETRLAWGTRLAAARPLAEFSASGRENPASASLRAGEGSDYWTSAASFRVRRWRLSCQPRSSARIEGLKCFAQV